MNILGDSFKFIGNGWCRASDGWSLVTHYFKDHSNPTECKLKCLNEPSRTGYAISNSRHSYPNRCFVHGDLRPDSFNGWTFWTASGYLRRKNLRPVKSEGTRNAKCYQRNNN